MFNCILTEFFIYFSVFPLNHVNVAPIYSDLFDEVCNSIQLGVVSRWCIRLRGDLDPWN